VQNCGRTPSFVACLLDGEKVGSLYREFGIAHKTGCKVFYRYKDCGIDGLTDRCRFRSRS
jgi:putative transposase